MLRCRHSMWINAGILLCILDCSSKDKKQPCQLQKLYGQVPTCMHVSGNNTNSMSGTHIGKPTWCHTLLAGI